jgi:molybdopterin/thiamine biosynthesis adenylyltransferase
MKIHIIGCGTIGSRLAIKLCEQALVSEINIYDDDIVTKKDPPIFLESSIGRNKCLIVEKYIKLILRSINTVKIYVSNNLVVKNINSNDLIIDCRDKKEYFLKSNIRVSYDNNLFYIDTTKQYFDTYRNLYSEYYFKKKLCYIDLSVSILVSFITSKIWKKKRSLFIYKLDEILSGKECLLDDNKEKTKRIKL